MSSLKERIFETIASDLEKIKSLDSPKMIRKECNMLLKRIEDAKKLFTDEPKLLELEKRIRAYSSSIN